MEDYPYLMQFGSNTANYDLTLKNLLPLFRTGLMLSGAEGAWMKGRVSVDKEDGVICGEEIAALDLSGLDLVTLLACDTGRGDIDELEGVMGLRRALKMAGCSTLVTAAWSLDMEAADAYLREFYTSLAGGMGIFKAHRHAQLELIRRFDAPYYWAAFQLID